jgi:hypothetical protein
MEDKMSEEIHDEIEDSLTDEKEEAVEIEKEIPKIKSETVKGKKEDIPVFFRVKSWDWEDIQKTAQLLAKSEKISRATPSAVAKYLLEDAVKYYRQKGVI